MILTEHQLSALNEHLRFMPTLTVYVDTSWEGVRGGEEWRACIRSRIATIRQTLRLESRAERASFERSVSRLEMRLGCLRRAARSPGWIVVIADGDVHHFTALSTRVATEVHWTRGPSLASYPSVCGAVCASADESR